MSSSGRIVHSLTIVFLLTMLLMPIGRHVRAQDSTDGTPVIVVNDTPETTPVVDPTQQATEVPADSSLTIDLHDAGTQDLIPGACFQLLADDQVTSVTGSICDAVSGADGITLISGLASGNYVLVQTTAPDGYVVAAPIALSLASHENMPVFVENDRSPVPTEIPTTTPTETPVATSVSKEISTNQVSIASVPDATKGEAFISVLNANGDALQQSCVSYNQWFVGGPVTTICDNVPNSSDDRADGIIHITALGEGEWLFQAFDISGAGLPNPLPLIIPIAPGETVHGNITLGRFGSVVVLQRGTDGKTVSDCAMLSWSFGDLGSTHPNGPFQNGPFATACDGDDGVLDGKSHFDDVPVGSYWVSSQSDGNRVEIDDFSLQHIAVTSNHTTTTALDAFSVQITTNVYDADTGAHLGTAQVLMRQMSDDGMVGTTRLSYDGSTTTIPAGNYTLTAHDRFSDLYDEAVLSPMTFTHGQVKTLNFYVHRKATPTPTPSPTPTQTPTATPNPVNCTLSAAAGVVDSSTTINCTGFKSKEKVSVFWDKSKTKPIGRFTADSRGAGKVTVVIPGAYNGVHTLDVRGTKTTTAGVMNFRVQANVMLSKTSGPAGTKVTATLTGFKAGEKIDLYWFPDKTLNNFNLKIGFTASSTGKAKVTFTIPANQSVTSHAIQALGESTEPSNAWTDFTVTKK